MKKSNNTVGATTYEILKHDIIFGKLLPGSKLKLSQLKEQYSASVSTLRETLNSLASEGFVTAEEQRGFFVTPISRKDFLDIANLRILLESHALKASIENGDADWEGDLVAAHHKLQKMEALIKADDHSDEEKFNWKRYDMEFHQALISACESSSLLSLHSTIYDKYLRYQMLKLTFRGDETNEHHDLLEAALAKDVEKAQKILEEHIRGGLNHSMPDF